MQIKAPRLEIIDRQTVGVLHVQVVGIGFGEAYAAAVQPIQLRQQAQDALNCARRIQRFLQ